MFSKNKLLIQNLTPANKLNFWLLKTIPSHFFRNYCHRKQLFHLVKTYFSTNPSFRLTEIYSLSCANSMLFFRAFLCYWKPLLKLEGTNFKTKNIFLPVETIFFGFLAKRSSFSV